MWDILKMATVDTAKYFTVAKDLSATSGGAMAMQYILVLLILFQLIKHGHVSSGSSVQRQSLYE